MGLEGGERGRGGQSRAPPSAHSRPPAGRPRGPQEEGAGKRGRAGACRLARGSGAETQHRLGKDRPPSRQLPLPPLIPWTEPLAGGVGLRWGEERESLRRGRGSPGTGGKGRGVGGVSGATRDPGPLLPLSVRTQTRGEPTELLLPFTAPLPLWPFSSLPRYQERP